MWSLWKFEMLWVVIINKNISENIVQSSNVFELHIRLLLNNNLIIYCKKTTIFASKIDWMKSVPLTLE